MSDDRARTTKQMLRDGPFGMRLLALLVAVTFGQPLGVLALPNGANVIAGSAAVSRPSPQSMVIQQGTPRAIINWQGFSIGSPESVVFQQPGASSAVLNRVVGAQRSDIQGAMTANGQVFLVNPNGVLFGPGASVHVGAMVASTLDIKNEDFLKGRYHFGTSGSGGAVTNAGHLQASNGGTVALLGGQVQNDGTIVANLGSAVLAAGKRVTLDFAGDGLTKVTVDEAALGAQVRNSGAIVVDGGQAVMTARAADQVVRTVVNQSGVIRATSLVERDGRIVLDGGDTGRTQVSGTLDASGRTPGARGGKVEVQGREVDLAEGARIDASGDRGGGTVLVGGDSPIRNSRNERNSGQKHALETPLARATTMASGASIAADALSTGHGGRVVLRSTGSTKVRGKISATGGRAGGNGGLVETSGKRLDVGGARVDAGAPRGKPGTWLLDPVDVTIDPEAAASISDSLATSDVDVTTDSIEEDPGQAGDITVAASIAKVGGPGTATKLSLRAARNIVVEPEVQISSTSGPLHVDLIARKDAPDVSITGRVELLPGSAIRTNGGDLLISGGRNPRDLANGRAVGSMDITFVDEVPSVGFASGVALSGSTIDTRRAGAAPGSVELRGRGPDVREIPFAIDMGSSDTGLSGVTLSGSSLTGGNVVLDGTGGYVDTISDGSGAGVLVNSSTVESPSSGGAVRIFGFGNDVAPASVGVRLGGGECCSPVTVRANDGEILIGGEGSAQGVYISAPTLIQNVGAASGKVDIRGLSSQTRGAAPALRIDEGATIEAAGIRGEIVLGAAGLPGNPGDLFQAGNGDSVPSITTSGSVVVGSLYFNRDGSRAASDSAIDLGGALRAGAPFNLSAFELSNLASGASTLIVGGSWQRQAITLQAPMNLPTNLTLQQDESPGIAAGIAINAPLSVRGTLALRSGGAITQMATAGVSAADLLLSSGSGALAFDIASNSVGRLAMNAGGGSASFVNSASLTIGGVTAAGSVGGVGTGTAQFSLAQSRAAGSFFAEAVEGNLRLENNIATGGGEITLVTPGVLDNAANATLSPGGSRWLVQAGTWRGENRGGLVPSAPLPNMYGVCGDCEGGSGVEVPATGNHFVYVERPILEFTTPSASRAYGDPNPAFPIVPVSGLQSILGDTLADAVVGSFTTAATPTSNVGVYPVEESPFAASFFSPAGYILRPEGASLTITPAMLTYLANPASREYGVPNPPLGGTVIGFRNGETVSTATTGTLAFTTPATITSSVGTYPINGEGLVANHGNYLFMQAPSNATALSIDRALLTYVANASSREYGLANPPLNGTVAGFRNGDTIATATTGSLLFTTPATPRSDVGSYPVTGSGLVATDGNYGFAQAPSNATALTITPAMLTYTADPAARIMGAQNPPFTGTVFGLRAGDTLATATRGELRFETEATAASGLGNYPIEGSGLSAVNYVFRQAASNSIALTVLLPDFGVPPILGNPRNPETEPTFVYERNFGLPGMCLPVGTLATSTGQAATSDLLEIEWTRVRNTPNLSNCVNLGDRDYCSAF